MDRLVCCDKIVKGKREAFVVGGLHNQLVDLRQNRVNPFRPTKLLDKCCSHL